MPSSAVFFFVFFFGSMVVIFYGWIWLSVLTFRSAFRSGFGVSRRVRWYCMVRCTEINVGSARSACRGSLGAIEEVHLLRSGSSKALPLLIFLIHISV